MRRGGGCVRARRDRGRGKCAHAIRPAMMNRRNAKAGGFTGAGICGSETGFGMSGPAISCNAKAMPYRVLRQRDCARRAQSLAVPSATREPILTETFGIPRATTERLACISLCPARAKPRRSKRSARAGPYGYLRHDLHCHGAPCVHEPAPGASGTATCRNAKAMTLINGPAPASPPRLPIHLTPSARAIRPAAPRAPAR